MDCHSSSNEIKPKDSQPPTISPYIGKETGEATVIIRNKTLEVLKGHLGKANFQLTADSQTWLGFLAKEKIFSGPYSGEKFASKAPYNFLKPSLGVFRRERHARTRKIRGIAPS